MGGEAGTRAAAGAATTGMGAFGGGVGTALGPKSHSSEATSRKLPNAATATVTAGRSQGVVGSSTSVWVNGTMSPWVFRRPRKRATPGRALLAAVCGAGGLTGRGGAGVRLRGDAVTADLRGSLSCGLLCEPAIRVACGTRGSCAGVPAGASAPVRPGKDGRCTSRPNTVFAKRGFSAAGGPPGSPPSNPNRVVTDLLRLYSVFYCGALAGADGPKKRWRKAVGACPVSWRKTREKYN